MFLRLQVAASEIRPKAFLDTFGVINLITNLFSFASVVATIAWIGNTIFLYIIN